MLSEVLGRGQHGTAQVTPEGFLTDMTELVSSVARLGGELLAADLTHDRSLVYMTYHVLLEVDSCG